LRNLKSMSCVPMFRYATKTTYSCCKTCRHHSPAALLFSLP